MKKSNLVNILLVGGGLIGIGVGSAQLFVPVAFEASAGIRLEDNISLLSEIRGTGGTLLVGGILIALGAFNSKMIFTSIVLSCLFYLSYGLSRIFSMVMDGIPTESLVIVTGLEIAIGLISLFVLYRFGKQLS